MKKLFLVPCIFVGTSLITGCSGIGLFDNNEPVSLSRSTDVPSLAVESNSSTDVSFETPESRLNSLCSTWEGCVLVAGWDNAVDFEYDISNLTEEEKNSAIEKGLENLAYNVSKEELKDLNTTVLTGYFYIKKDFKKSMYWAFKGVEIGSSYCMRILSNAYRSGEGVVQNLEEGVKWVYLGAAAGDEWCQKWVKKNGITGLTNEYMAPILKEARKRANQWMNEHPELFISLE